MNKKNYLVLGMVFLGLVGTAFWTGQVSGKMQAVPLAIWSTTGSTGSVQPFSDGKVKQIGPALAFKPSKTGTAYVQYPFTPTDGYWWNVQLPAVADFTIRYKDNGSFAQVVLKLIAVNVNNGSQTTIHKFDSDDFATSNNGITRTIPIVLTKGWDQHVYYIAGSLKKSGTEGTPEIIAIQVKAF